MTSNQEEFDLWAFVANLAVIYGNKQKERVTWRTEREGRKGEKTKPVRCHLSQSYVRT